MEENKEQSHEEKKHEFHVHHEVSHKKKKSNTWMYVSGVLVVLLVISLYFNFSSGGATGALSAETASVNIMDFINNNLMQGGMEAELKNIEEVGGVYQVDLDVGGQEFISYVSKDGEIFFPQGYVLAELKEELSGAAAPNGEVETAAAAVKSDEPNVKMFVMTFCPYGQQAEDGLGPALEVLGDSVDFEPHFVIYGDYATRMGAKWEDFCWDEEEQYCSMHGIGELNEGVRQLCVFNDNPDKWWDYVNAINAGCSYGDVDVCWESVAEDVGLDVAEIEGCFDEKGELFLKKELLLNKQFGVQGSPMVFINDAAFNGGRAPESYKAGICDAFNEAPLECGEELSTTGAAAEGSC